MSTLIHPNPSGDEIHLATNSFSASLTELTILDMTGREVTKAFPGPTVNHRITPVTWRLYSTREIVIG